MSETTGNASHAPTVLRPEQDEALWFIGMLATVRANAEMTGGQSAVVEVLAPKGAGSPLHVHRREDEWFYVIEGEVTFWLDGTVVTAVPGSFLWGPRDIPHTFEVSAGPARMLIGTQPAGFEDFIRAASVPAQSLAIPGPDVKVASPQELTAKAAEYGIEIIGPPGIPA